MDRIPEILMGDSDAQIGSVTTGFKAFISYR